MQPFLPRVLVLVVFSLAFVPGKLAAQTSSPGKNATLRAARRSQSEIPLHANSQYGGLPIVFEENHGQVDPSVGFIARGSGYTST